MALNGDIHERSPSTIQESAEFQKRAMTEPIAQCQSEFDFTHGPLPESVTVSKNRHANLFPLSDAMAVHSWQYVHVKRWIDIAGSLILISVSIIPGLLIAAAVALTSRGPIFYREMRVGRGGRPFRIWKFRTMRHKPKWQRVIEAKSASVHCLNWRVHKSLRDVRITAVGDFLRSWSLDEIPQVLNVLRGEMSLIGPRPVVEAEIPLYGRLRHFYLAATPGLSGLWQVSGRSNLAFPLRADLDASYVKLWSLSADFGILFRTIPALLGRVGAR